MGDMIDRDAALKVCREAMTLDGALQRIAALETVTQPAPDAYCWPCHYAGSCAKHPPAPDAAVIREAAKRVTGTALHDIFVKRMSHAYVDEDPIELKGVCMDGYFNLIQIAKDIRALITEKPHD